MRITLELIGTKANKNEVHLELPATIGRSREASLTVGHPMISRKHCELFEREGRVLLRDLGSLNGTIIRDQAVGEAVLGPGEEFTIGPVTFRVHYTVDTPILSGPQESAAGDIPIATPIDDIPVALPIDDIPSAIPVADAPLDIPVAEPLPGPEEPPPSENNANEGLILFDDGPAKPDSRPPQHGPTPLSEDELNEFLNGFKP